MRDPPLCQLWQLEETGPGTYSLNQLADMHEAMDEEAEYEFRFRSLPPPPKGGR